jgi:hypothetical protein
MEDLNLRKLVIPNLCEILRAKACGAKKRDGTPCPARPMLNGRCRMHGGKSRSGIAHPNYKHGKFSKGHPAGLFHRTAIANRKRLRARIKEIRAMSNQALRSYARWLFGLAARGVTADDMRFMLLATTEAAIERSLAAYPPR